MTHSRIYEVRAESADGSVHAFGAPASRSVAEQVLQFQQSISREEPFARWWIEEIDPSAVWRVPTTPGPRTRYRTRLIETNNRSCHVEVWRDQDLVAEYDRNDGQLMSTFEPFRQGDREFALISRDFERTAVLDLQTGEVIAEEALEHKGFIPEAFFVPDWWDGPHRDLVPGTLAWKSDYEWPTGDFGFVLGFVWGDNAETKVQYLDLSKVQQGIIVREERFGWLPVDTDNFPTQDLVACSVVNGIRQVDFRGGTFCNIWVEGAEEWLAVTAPGQVFNEDYVTVPDQAFNIETGEKLPQPRKRSGSRLEWKS